jgi:hypothetical protein
LTELAILRTSENLPFAVGAASYYDSAEPGAAAHEPRIYIRIELAGTGIELLAMVDTAAPWCILEPHLAAAVADHLEELPGEAVISTRVGRFSGKLYLGTTTILAEKGEGFTVATTFFLSPEWPAGNFVGYQVFLDRFRFAGDPGENRFYFGPLG